MRRCNVKKIMFFTVVAVMAFVLTGCGEETADGDEDLQIAVISREEGSGTRDAFTNLTGVMVDDIDYTVDTAEISNSNAVVMQSVAGNEAAIGYISTGNYDESVKMLKINGVEPTAQNIKADKYELQRSFSIVTKHDIDKLSQDFIDFILSKEGQKVIEEAGYVSVSETPEQYKASGYEGTITVAGSTSVAPVIELLADDYKKLNNNVDIQVQQTGSSAGIQGVVEGICDIGITSRSLKEKEMKNDIKIIEIAKDGIAVIVNKNNALSDISKEQVKRIFAGEITSWNDFN